jgi:hypothetical protein
VLSGECSHVHFRKLSRLGSGAVRAVQLEFFSNRDGKCVWLQWRLGEGLLVSQLVLTGET